MHSINVLNPERHGGDGLNNSYISYEIISQLVIKNFDIYIYIYIILLHTSSSSFMYFRREKSSKLEGDTKISYG